MAENGFHEEEALGKAYDARLMRRLLSYLKPYRGVTALAVALLLIGSATQVALPWLIQVAIDDYIAKQDASGFSWIVMGYLVVMLVSFGSTYGQTYITMWLGQKVQFDIRMQVFKHLQKLHLGYFDKNPVGRMLTRVTNDVNVLDELFSSGVVSIVGDIFTLIFIFAMLLYYNWQLALITFLVLPLLIAATFVFRAKVRDVYREVRLKTARLNAYLQEHLTGIRIVQLFTQEARAYDKFDKINTDLRTQHFRSVYYYAVFFPTVELIGTLSAGLLLYFGGVKIETQLLTFGELVAFIQLVQRFYRPIQDLSEKYNILQSSMASSERIFQLLDTPVQVVETVTPVAPPRFSGKIDVEHLWFAYNEQDWVLKDVSFSVAPREKVALVGATGAGKSSMVSLLYRFYDYQKGSIKLDGVELKDMQVSDLRSHLGLVLQDVFLFSGDYASNVRLRDQKISDDEIRRALTRVGYDRFFDRMPQGIKTTIQERGATLSTGQKQLLSFARALAYNPDILILDEATSSIDTETERLIQQALDELMAERTSIIIAHRLSTIEKADKIIVLHKGEIREMGKHQELLDQRGIYYKLYQLQYRRQQGEKPVERNA